MTRAPTRHAAFLATGLLATAAQVLLLRELIVDVTGDEAAIGVGLAAWLIGIALGAALARRRGEAASPRDAARGLALLAILPALAIVCGRVLRYALAPDAGELPGLGLTLLLAVSTLLPSGAAVGWVFTTLAASAARRWPTGEAVVRLYVGESLGSLAGGLLVTLAAGRVLPLRLAALVGLAGALVALGGRRSGMLAGTSSSYASALCVLLAAGAGPLDDLTERIRFAGTAGGVAFLTSTDTPYQHLAVGGGEVRHLYAGGQYSSSFPDPYASESLGHLLALLAPRPERVLLVGGSERGLVPVLLRHPVARLTLVEPDAAALRFLLPQLPDADRAALRAPRVRIAYEDPRRFLSRPESGAFDLVLLLGPEPTTLLRARLATVEFFRLVARHLSPEGVVVISLPPAPTVLTGETEALAGALVRSLREALPVVHATLATEALAVAGWSAAAATLDPATLAARWGARGLRSPAFEAAALPVLLEPERVAAHEQTLFEAARRAPPSSDDRPLSFVHALARRQQLVADARGRMRMLRAAVSVPPWLLVALAFAPSLFAARRLLVRGVPPARAAALASHAVAVTGAAGLGWTLLVLFSFQTNAGALYGQLGALIAVFMLGLALGALIAGITTRLVARSADAAHAAKGALHLLHAALAGAFAFGASLPFTLRAAAGASDAGAFAAFLAYGGLLLAAGLVTGSVFPLATEARLAAGESAAEAAGRIESADHVGAALAGLLGAVLFVPRLGIVQSALLLAGLLAVALALSLAGSPPARNAPGRADSSTLNPRLWPHDRGDS